VKPHHVHWRTVIIAFEAGFRPYGGVAAVAPDDQIGMDLDFTVRTLRLNTDNPSIFLDQPDGFRLHPQIERPIVLAVIRESLSAKGYDIWGKAIKGDIEKLVR
jgi:hypothetical protein